MFYQNEFLLSVLFPVTGFPKIENISICLLKIHPKFLISQKCGFPPNARKFNAVFKIFWNRQFIENNAFFAIFLRKFFLPCENSPASGRGLCPRTMYYADPLNCFIPEPKFWRRLWIHSSNLISTDVGAQIYKMFPYST